VTDGIVIVRTGDGRIRSFPQRVVDVGEESRLDEREGKPT
jgi:hypothetical protein